MQTVIKGRNIEVSESLRRYVESKCAKLPRYLDNILVIEVELSSEKTRSAETRQVVQMTVDVSGTLLRAEVHSDNMFAAVDTALDKIRRQIKSYKDRLYNRSKTAASRATSTRAPQVADDTENAEEAELADVGGRVVRVKHFAVKPMTAEEAIDQMEYLGHDFFVFLEGAGGDLNVVYRRRDGAYGVLIPDNA